ncbi:transposase, partial [Oligoflexia bacterium]|nr:transposase [Oligoflexia bacterium]
MPAPRKVHYNDAVLFITTSLEEGLLMPANPIIKLFLESVLARAQELYPVCICAFLFEANHLHMLLVVKDPNDIKDFMRYIKTESSHAINRMLGRKKRTNWCEGYDSPIMCKFEMAMEKLIYIYTNPAKDNLESSIELYPHLSSWSMVKTGRHTRVVPCLARDDAPYLGTECRTLYELKKTAKFLRGKASKVKGSYAIEPTAWLDAFGITEESDQKLIWECLVEEIKEKEVHYEALRQKENKTVIGSKALQAAP